jgi:hypothetical protein
MLQEAQKPGNIQQEASNHKPLPQWHTEPGHGSQPKTANHTQHSPRTNVHFSSYPFWALQVMIQYSPAQYVDVYTIPGHFIAALPTVGLPLIHTSKAQTDCRVLWNCLCSPQYPP